MDAKPKRSRLAERSRGVLPPDELQHFLDTFLYREEAVLVDEITSVDMLQLVLNGGVPQP